MSNWSTGACQIQPNVKLNRTEHALHSAAAHEAHAHLALSSRWRASCDALNFQKFEFSCHSAQDDPS
jgi:hypothetical protein